VIESTAGHNLAGRYCTATLSFARFQFLFSAASVQKSASALMLYQLQKTVKYCVWEIITSGSIICIEKFQTRLSFEEKL
jgi:hypothetical protein